MNCLDLPASKAHQRDENAESEGAMKATDEVPTRNYRTESDSLGEVKVPADKLWGA
jgi:hypothetical protein